ncbi:lysosome membrane protein 2-like [Megalops cyprinoides]|uniref:lysosome membrane protein 2-like n=1 Tax=Megalops cyprinoides TaxID=118141 RepID=UPI0018645467|nr:lysosome membrane protein 2-like [Megalops cyprinoides]XP_036385482.1 lysosome membrane protein 2-like [Megalops cyprinoides]
MTRRSCAVYATGIVCAHLLIVGIALIVAQVFQTLIHNRLKKEITLTEGSRVFETWKNPPPPVYMQYFFFNVTNPKVFLAGGRASVTQMGPYTYREYRPRENVTFVDNGTKVSAYTPKSFVFEPEMSVGDPEVDLVTTVNIPALAVMNKVKGSFFMGTMVSMWMNSIGVGVFMTRPVHELLWGFKDPLLTRIHPMKPEIEEYFGLMYKKNGTSDGEFVFHTGEQNYMDYGKIHTWRGESQTQYWATNLTNMINGTDGSVFHPLLSKEEQLYVFSPDLCRSIYMKFVKDVEIKGIPAYRFAPPRSVLASREENPANAGFCLPGDQCLGTGVLRVSVCRKGAPVVVSFPHFYQGDEKYIKGVAGLSPNQEDHETFLDINPTTGVPIRASKRAQINILVNRISGFPQTKSINETVFPIVFVNETVVIDDASAAKMRTLLLMVMLVSNLPLLIVGMGVILLIVLIVLIYKSRQKKTTAKEDTAYTQVSDKAEELADDPSNQYKNGSYIVMTPVEGGKC